MDFGFLMAEDGVMKRKMTKKERKQYLWNLYIIWKWRKKMEKKHDETASYTKGA